MRAQISYREYVGSAYGAAKTRGMRMKISQTSFLDDGDLVHAYDCGRGGWLFATMVGGDHDIDLDIAVGESQQVAWDRLHVGPNGMHAVVGTGAGALLAIRRATRVFLASLQQSGKPFRVSCVPSDQKRQRVYALFLGKLGFSWDEVDECFILQY